MDIYVLNKNNEVIDVIDTYKSAIWDLKYNERGECELYIAADQKAVTLLAIGNRLARDKDIMPDGSMYHVMTINKIQLTTDDEEGDNLIITGYDLKDILRQRIVWQQTNLSGSVEADIEKLVDENAIKPSIPARQIDGFMLKLPGIYTQKHQQQITGDNLYDTVVDILQTYQAGWDVYIDAANNYVMTLYAGTDRSINQDTNPHIVFSAGNENITDDTYSVDYTNYKTTVVVAGEGEGLNRRRSVVGGSAKGLERYEGYTDSRNVSSNDGEISEKEYTALLVSDGKDYISENSYVENYEGSIETNGMYTYNTDYFLGDVVTVANKYGITANPRILRVIESVSDEGETVIPSLSTWIGE